MIIPIGSDYRITSTRHSWAVEVRALSSKRKWKRLSHHTSLLDSLRHVSDHNLRNSKAITVADALNEVVKISEQIADAFAPMITLDLSKILNLKLEDK